MPFRAKDIPLAVLAAAAAHPTRVLVLGIAATMALQALGIVGPGDWWGAGQEVGR